MASQSDERRTFFKKAVAALLTIGTGSFLYSILHYFSPKTVHIQSQKEYSGIFDPETYRAKKKLNAFIPVKTSDGNFEIDLGTLPEGESAIMSLSDVPVIAVNQGNKYRIFNATCTHLGCLVKWDKQTRQFLCPCHGGIYNENGEVVTGPPPSSIKQYHTAVTGTSVKIMMA